MPGHEADLRYERFRVPRGAVLLLNTDVAQARVLETRSRTRTAKRRTGHSAPRTSPDAQRDTAPGDYGSGVTGGGEGRSYCTLNNAIEYSRLIHWLVGLTYQRVSR